MSIKNEGFDKVAFGQSKPHQNPLGGSLDFSYDEPPKAHETRVQPGFLESQSASQTYGKSKLSNGLEALQKHGLFPAFSVLSVILWYIFNLYVSKSQWGSIVLGGLLVFLVPGYSWGLTLARDSAGLERFVISVVLSVSLVILSLLAINLALKVPLNQTTVLWDIVLISIAGLARWWLARPTK